MAKKTTTKKGAKKSTKKEVDINNVETLVEDMKKLALEKSEEGKEEKSTFVKSKKEETKPIETVVEQDLPQSTEEEMVAEENVEIIKDEIKEEEKVEVSNEKDDDLSFIDEIKGEKLIEKPKETKQKMTYESMFGPTWCGYGYTE